MPLIDFDETAGRLQGLAIELAPGFGAQEAADIDEFIEHAELGEALRAIAWIVVEEDMRISAAQMAEILELARRMDMTSELPEGISGQIAD